ncbi:MAG: hypothetical protein U0P30_14920 [Vicinamibacterales bacterium]
MASAVIVVGGLEALRRDLEKHLGDRAHLLVLRMARSGGFRLEAHPTVAVQMLEGATDRADSPQHVLVVVLPYAPCPEELGGTIAAIEDLGATVIRAQAGAGRWPSRPPALDGRFQEALRAALLAVIDSWLPGDPPPDSVPDAIDRARRDFAETLHIPDNLPIDTSLDGPFWYGVLAALHDLCEIERRGEAPNKRDILRDRLAARIRSPKRTYKVADTGVYSVHPSTGNRIELRERVHLVEGKPAETESVYWVTIGDERPSYRYLIGRLGRHA